MTSEKQIAANRRNAKMSTGPRTGQGKKKSRQNALKHGLTSETVIEFFEKASEYSAFEAALKEDYKAKSTLENALVSRLTSLLWRLRRATAIESGLFGGEIHLSSGSPLQDHLAIKSISDCAASLFRQPSKIYAKEVGRADLLLNDENGTNFEKQSHIKKNQKLHLVRHFTQLEHVNGAFDRLSRYEAALWRQTVQSILILDSLAAVSSKMFRSRVRKKRARVRSNRPFFPTDFFARR